MLDQFITGIKTEIPALSFYSCPSFNIHTHSDISSTPPFPPPNQQATWRNHFASCCRPSSLPVSATTLHPAFLFRPFRPILSLPCSHRTNCFSSSHAARFPSHASSALLLLSHYHYYSRSSDTAVVIAASLVLAHCRHCHNHPAYSIFVRSIPRLSPRALGNHVFHRYPTGFGHGVCF